MRINAKVITVKSSAEAGEFDSLADIVKCLGSLGLCRDARDHRGRVFARDIRLRCAVFSMLWLAFAFLCASFRMKYSYWKDDGNSMEKCNEIFHSILLHVQVAVVLWTPATETEDNILRYYTDLTSLDDFLEIRNRKYYEREKKLLNLRFFSLASYYFLKQFCETVLLIMDFGYADVLPFTNDYLANVIQIICQFHFFIRLSVFRRRLVMLCEKLERDLKTCREINSDELRDRYFEAMINNKYCYMLLHEQHKIINKDHGLKIALSIACHVISVIRNIYSMLAYATSRSHPYGATANTVRTVPDVALLSALVIYIASIGQLRDRLLSKLEPLQCDRTLSERERGSVLAVIELVHRQPLRFTAYDFFTLDMPLLCALLNFFITYIIILTQIMPPDVSSQN